MGVESSFTNCGFHACDFVGPWPEPFKSARAAVARYNPLHEPEVYGMPVPTPRRRKWWPW